MKELKYKTGTIAVLCFDQHFVSHLNQLHICFLSRLTAAALGTSLVAQYNRFFFFPQKSISEIESLSKMVSFAGGDTGFERLLIYLPL